MKRFLTWAGRGLAGCVALLALLLGGVYAVSAARLAETYTVTPAAPATVPGDSAAAARGGRVAALRGCADCHGADFGGRVFLDDPALGRIVASNLTPGGRTTTWADADWDRAVRHGVAPDGRGLLIMPSAEYHALTDADFADLVVYLKGLPAVERELPPSRVGPVGRALWLAGQMPLVPAAVIDHDAERSAPTPGPTAAYGAYLATACQGCHGADLAGAPGHGPPGTPRTPALTPASQVGRWTDADLVQTLRTGVRPDGSRLDPAKMPWPMTAAMTDDEMRALVLYLRSLPAAPPSR